MLGKAEKERKKKIAPMSSYPICNREFQKNSKKFQKIKKTNTIMPSFQTKIGWKRLRKRENKKKKSFIWVPTRPVIENFKKKIAKKLTKFKKEKKTLLRHLFKPK